MCAKEFDIWAVEKLRFGEAFLSRRPLGHDPGTPQGKGDVEKSTVIVLFLVRFHYLHVDS
jgi:hypothetical protein